MPPVHSATEVAPPPDLDALTGAAEAAMIGLHDGCVASLIPIGQVTRPVSFLAGAVPASFVDFLANGQAPSWLVRVGTYLTPHFPAASLRLCLDRLGLLCQEPSCCLFMILPGAAAKETHSSAKETHSAIIGRRLADFSIRATCVADELADDCRASARRRMTQDPALVARRSIAELSCS